MIYTNYVDIGSNYIPHCRLPNRIKYANCYFDYLDIIYIIRVSLFNHSIPSAMQGNNKKDEIDVVNLCPAKVIWTTCISDTMKKRKESLWRYILLYN